MAKIIFTLLFVIFTFFVSNNTIKADSYLPDDFIGEPWDNTPQFVSFWDKLDIEEIFFLALFWIVISFISLIPGIIVSYYYKFKDKQSLMIISLIGLIKFNLLGPIMYLLSFTLSYILLDIYLLSFIPSYILLDIYLVILFISTIFMESYLLYFFLKEPKYLTMLKLSLAINIAIIFSFVIIISFF